MSSINIYEATNIGCPSPVSSRGHQRSRTTFDLPPLHPRKLSVSPNRSSTFILSHQSLLDASPDHRMSAAASVTPDSPNNESQSRVKVGTVGKIASWFEGASEPVNIALVPSPNKEKPEPFYQLDQHYPSTPKIISSMDNFTLRPQSRSSNGQTSANSSRFNFFKRTPPTPIKSDPNELIQLDIREALLPTGSAEEVTPAAYKALQLNAESLLRRFQLAYTQNIDALRELTTKRSEQADELEAEKTRNEHLRLQLLEMAEKAADQEKVITSLKSQLINPQSSIRMITDNEQIDLPNRNRRARFSDVSASDESFVDSEASSALSVFSEVESVRTPSTSVASSPMMKYARMCSPMVIQGPSLQAPVTPTLVQQCQTCHNMSASEAWDIVELMKIESTALKERITELETANDSALDLLTALRL